jgi:hypothetical protein
MLYRSSRALAVETPDFVQDRFQADAMLVDGPQFDLAVREGSRDRSQQRPQVFFERRLLRWIGQDMARTGFTLLAVQAHQVRPA